MSLRPEEYACATALAKHLEMQYGILCSWQPVRPDPPDVEFRVTWPNGVSERWAVEITGLFQRYHHQTANDGRTRLDFEPRIARIVERLNRELGPHMQHGYWLIASGPLDPNVLADLEQRIRAYIASGRTQDEPLDGPEITAALRRDGLTDPSNPIFRQLLNERTTVTIKGDPGSGILLMTSISGSAKIPNSDDLVANIEGSLDHATSYIAAKKMPRMAKVAGYDRKVLLVWKSMPHVQPAEIGRSFGLKIQSGLDAIFLYEHGQERISLILDLGLPNTALRSP